MRFCDFVVMGSVLALLAGCSSNGPTSTIEELGQDANTRGFGRQFPEDPNENAFVFGVGDTVKIAVVNFPEFTADQVVRQDGMITIPQVNDVQAAGLTTDGLRKKLEVRLAALISEPQVTVSPGLVQSKGYFIVGSNPLAGGSVMRRMPYKGDTTLIDVYVQMGSPSTLLDDDTHVKVIRGDPRHPRVHTINVKEMVLLGYTAGNIPIRSDDIIVVPPTWLGKLNNFVASVALPFQSFFTVSRTVVAVDYTVRAIEGDDLGNLGFGIFGGGYGGGGYGGYGGGYGGNGFGGGYPGNYGSGTGGSIYP